MAKKDIGADVVGVIVSKARAESPFRTKLLSDGNGALKALGIPVPEGVTVKFVEDTPSLWHFVIPAQEGELSDAELGQVAGGINFSGQQLGGAQGYKYNPGGDVAEKFTPGGEFAPMQLGKKGF